MTKARKILGILLIVWLALSFIFLAVSMLISVIFPTIIEIAASIPIIQFLLVIFFWAVLPFMFVTMLVNENIVFLAIYLTLILIAAVFAGLVFAKPKRSKFNIIGRVIVIVASVTMIVMNFFIIHYGGMFLMDGVSIALVILYIIAIIMSVMPGCAIAYSAVPYKLKQLK